MELKCSKKHLLERLKRMARHACAEREKHGRRTQLHHYYDGRYGGLETAIGWLEIWTEKLERKAKRGRTTSKK